MSEKKDYVVGADARVREKKDYVVDLETLGTGSNAPVVAIGIVSFDRHTGAVGDEKFYCTIDMESACKYGAVAEGGTIDWWLRQSKAARSALTSKEFQVDALAAAAAALAFLEDEEGMFANVRMWGNGAAFDCEKLRNMFTRLGLVTPWNFWNERDVRTMLELYDDTWLPFPADKIKHHALHDAEHEAERLAIAFLMHHAARGALDTTISDHAYPGAPADDADFDPTQKELDLTGSEYVPPVSQD